MARAIPLIAQLIWTFFIGTILFSLLRSLFPNTKGPLAKRNEEKTKAILRSVNKHIEEEVDRQVEQKVQIALDERVRLAEVIRRKHELH